MVFGSGPNAGQAIVDHPDVPVISFTGSTMTGQRIAQSSAPFTKKLSLEVKKNELNTVKINLPYSISLLALCKYSMLFFLEHNDHTRP